MTYYLRLLSVKNSEVATYAILYFKAKNKKNVFFKFLFFKHTDPLQYVYTIKKEGSNYIVLMYKRPARSKVWLKFTDHVFRIDSHEIFEELL